MRDVFDFVVKSAYNLTVLALICQKVFICNLARLFRLNGYKPAKNW